MGITSAFRITSTVLGWDNAEFKEIVTKIKKDKSGPSQEHLDAVETYIDSTSRSHHEHLRALSITQSKSIVTVIFENSQYPPSSPLTKTQRAQALAYFFREVEYQRQKGDCDGVV